MVRKLKAQEEGRFADIVTIHQEAFALLDHEGMNVTDGRFPFCVTTIPSMRRGTAAFIRLSSFIPLPPDINKHILFS